MTTHFAQLVEDGAAVEVRSFTAQELDIITDALKIAAAHYQMLSELMCPMNGGTSSMAALSFRATFEQQSHDAGTLQLKIEAAR